MLVAMARRSSIISWGVAAAVAAAGAAFLTMRGDLADANANVPAASTRAASCAPTAAALPVRTPRRLGSWSFELVMRGTFGMVTSGANKTILALQACGAGESSLRIVTVNPRSADAVTSRRFEHAALIASSISAGHDVVWFGESRLSVGREGEPPYRLYLVALTQRRLAVTRTVALGRGYGLSLAEGPHGTVFASTGRQLLAVNSTGRVRVLASFPAAVAQHLAVVPGSYLGFVSLFTPSASASASSTKIAVVNLATGALISEIALGPGDEVESLAATTKNVLVVVASGETTSLERLPTNAPFRQLGKVTRGVSATLSPMTVLVTAGSVFVVGPNTLACAVGTGSSRASTSPSGTSEVVSEVAAAGPYTFATTPTGLGRLALPPACRRH
ncbi:MAG: hypothetical protein ACYCSF_12265 [Acidimicrobiales bacterium]